MTDSDSTTHNVTEGLALIKKSIEEEAKSKAAIVIKEAKAEAEAILKNAKEEAEKLKSSLLKEQEAMAKQILQKEISKKRLQGKMEVLETREQVIESLMTDLRTELQKYTKDKKYAETLESFFMEGALAIGGGDLVLQLRDEDKPLFPKEKLAELAKKIEKETGTPTTIELADRSLKTMGGLKVSAKDGSVWVDNTFESRIERQYDDLRIAIMRALA
ncbi:MAG: hypothetical protein D6732_07725 [Methanobacteriota archaeon]|nr:MAG: hypothetical protein D6732_07725 [Euryarchaeota archaeon]